MYAAIYTEVNPERSGEIWQYIHTINVAASAYQWSNVVYYDSTFRQLMAFKPHRSWAKTYHQGWNLAMKDPIGFSNQTQSNAGALKGMHHTGRTGDWRDYCCWKYNKNKCSRGSGCHYDHRCMYCGSWNHGFYNCRKRLSKEKKNGDRADRHRRGSSPRKH